MVPIGRAPARGGAPPGACALAAALLAASGASCSDDAHASPPLLVRRTVASLVRQPERWRILRPPPEGRVEARTLAPVDSLQRDGSALPCLVVPPGSRVAIDLTGLPADAELELALGVDATSHAIAGGIVELVAETDASARVRHRLRYGTSVEPNERAWRRARISLRGASTLRLATRLVRGEGAPLAGFGLLHVTSTHAVAPDRASPERPSWIVILVDTLRADRVGATRDGEPLTPELDALAARGTLFESAWAPAPWTWPSTASILTGLPPPAHGVLDADSCYLAPELVTLAEALQDAGLGTAAFSVNPLIRAERDFDQGFDAFRAYAWARADVVLEDVVEHLRTLGERRSFLYVHLGDPHEYAPARRFRERWAGPPPPGFDPIAMRELAVAQRRGDPVDPEQWERWLAYKCALYDASVAQVDEAIGELVRALEREGLADRTCIAITADHGEELLEHGLLGHGHQLHAESLRVPLVLAGPGIARGERVPERVEVRHLAATVLAHAGVASDAFASGCDLLAPDERAAHAGALFAHTRGGQWHAGPGTGWIRASELHAVRHGDRLYVRAADETGATIGARAWDAQHDVELPLDAATAAELDRALDAWLEGASARAPRVLGGGAPVQELLNELGYGGDR